MVAFAPQALEGMADQVRSGYVTITAEHLTLVPPIGRWRDAEVVTADDGAKELIMYGRAFPMLRPVGKDPEIWADLASLHLDAAPTNVAIDHVGVEPRAFGTEKYDALVADAPIAVERLERWSTLPPLEWFLVIPVVWGAARFAGSFLDTLGRESAEALVRWLRRLPDEASDSNRDRVVTLQFELPDRSVVFGFVVIAVDEAFDATVLEALGAAGKLAEVSGVKAKGLALTDVRQAAFFWRDHDWHLGWLSTDEDVRVTHWYTANQPDLSRLLGRPFLGEAESIESSGA
jgi:hypothetical protein